MPTEHLDLNNPGETGREQLGHLQEILRLKNKIVVIAGAGISVSAGSKSTYMYIGG